MKKILISALLFSIFLSAGNIDIFVDKARKQVGKTLTYNPEYVRLKFPMGDIPISKGVCTDVVVRAFRGLGIDLQERIYKHKRSFQISTKGSTTQTN